MSFFGSSRRTHDEHGVAELLEAVSQRTMSCTDEERKELGDLAKRVQRKTKPGPVDLIQRKLSEIHNNSNGAGGGGSSSAFSSPVGGNKPKIPSLKDIGSPLNNWGKDLLKSFSKLQVPLSPERQDADPQRSSNTNTTPPGPTLLRDFGPVPTIVILPPEEPILKDDLEGDECKKDERQQDDSSSSSEDEEDTNDKLSEVVGAFENDQEATEGNEEGETMGDNDDQVEDNDDKEEQEQEGEDDTILSQ